MTRRSIEVTFAVDDETAEYDIENDKQAEEELMEALDELPPTVGISHVENHGENQ